MVRIAVSACSAVIAIITLRSDDAGLTVTPREYGPLPEGFAVLHPRGAAAAEAGVSAGRGTFMRAEGVPRGEARSAVTLGICATWPPLMRRRGAEDGVLGMKKMERIWCKR